MHSPLSFAVLAAAFLLPLINAQDAQNTVTGVSISLQPYSINL